MVDVMGQGITHDKTTAHHSACIIRPVDARRGRSRSSNILIRNFRLFPGLKTPLPVRAIAVIWMGDMGQNCAICEQELGGETIDSILDRHSAWEHYKICCPGCGLALARGLSKRAIKEIEKRWNAKQDTNKPRRTSDDRLRELESLLVVYNDEI